MGNSNLHRILRFCMGSHHLPIEEGRHFNLPRASRVCNLCNIGAVGDERHMLLECPALADLRLQFSSLLLSCSSVMRQLLWAKEQHQVYRYIIEEEEEERFTHPWQPTRLIGWNKVWGEQCHLHSIVRRCFRIRDPMIYYSLP